MSRPKHLKKITVQPFKVDKVDKIVMAAEESYALYLKDIEGKHQTECAQQMGISRGYFQQILDRAHKKVATAALTGASLTISGGEFVTPSCLFFCEDCKSTYEPKLVRDKTACPTCSSEHVSCQGMSEDCNHVGCPRVSVSE